MSTNARRDACLIILLLLTVVCLPILWVVFRIGITYKYTVHDWVSLCLPRSSAPADLAAWLLGLAVVMIPIATVIQIVRLFLARTRRRGEEKLR